MIGSYRDYVLIVFGIFFSLLTAILAAALATALETYFKKHAFLVIVFCLMAIWLLFKLFKRLIGLQFIKKTLDIHNLEEIREKFEERIKEIHPDMKIIFHVSLLKEKIVYIIQFSVFLLFYSVLMTFMSFLIMIFFYLLLSSSLTLASPFGL